MFIVYVNIWWFRVNKLAVEASPGHIKFEFQQFDCPLGGMHTINVNFFFPEIDTDNNKWNVQICAWHLYAPSWWQSWKVLNYWSLSHFVSFFLWMNLIHFLFALAFHTYVNRAKHCLGCCLPICESEIFRRFFNKFHSRSFLNWPQFIWIYFNI